MKKLFFVAIIALVALVACNTNDETTEPETEGTDEATTFTYQAETGPVEVPTNPERVVVLSGYTGDVIKLDVNIVGVTRGQKTIRRLRMN